MKRKMKVKTRKRRSQRKKKDNKKNKKDKQNRESEENKITDGNFYLPKLGKYSDIIYIKNNNKK